MKATLTLITVVATLLTQWSFGSPRIPIYIGIKVKIITIMKLPDRKEFHFWMAGILMSAVIRR